MPDREAEPEKSLRDAWERVAQQWTAWARKPGHDSYWRFHRAAFLRLVPPPGRLTLDIGCGEGRLARDLKALGHDVVAVDGSPTMVAAARAADPAMRILVADAAQLPFADGGADLAIAFMSLQDVDDMPGAVREIGRVLSGGGVACIAVIHPINSAGSFESEAADARFIIEQSYFQSRRTRVVLQREGLEMTFNSRHWPLQAYVEALEAAGLVIDALREVTVDQASADERPSLRRWRRLPLFLHLRARKR